MRMPGLPGSKDNFQKKREMQDKGEEQEKERMRRRRKGID